MIENINTNNNQPLISVVVPIFKVEKYLHRCVDSIMNQTYSNLEIILVDDGSPDNCGKLCDEYEKTDKRIKVIHKPNGGLASARNRGVAIANGNYISFIDSDDWIAQDTYEYCVSLINNAEEIIDIVQFGVMEAQNENDQANNAKEKITMTTGKDILNFLMVNSTRRDNYFSVCRCLFSSKLLKTEMFPEGKINEDIVYKYRVLSKANVMIDSNQIKYFYFQSTGSITTEGFKRKDLDLYTAADELRVLTKHETYGRINELGEVKYARTSFSLLCKIAYYGFDDTFLNKKETVRQFQKELRNNLGILLCSPMPLNRKLCAVLLSLNIKCLEIPLIVIRKFIG